ncbi:hypothetical protein OG689_16800 [Kitasatospora sp. NBC_00240]|uniref:hypothetical protein n=1 Tax=Kitasatospora sp. NBC_00240 TaxID=2903567 RepID=UPI0022571FE4|nr:hypothetical protein [Kitasatospora sp. NBC_00240]MCX5210931.1 hypothetical protein [Kitasatospora sp. NBC_00240]
MDALGPGEDDPEPAGSRGAVGDPVRELMARHRALCEQAVDPLEIAAVLEEAGLGPGAAARYRHADVFSLAEELYARVPRRPPDPGAAEPGESWRRRSGAALWTALASALPCAALAAVRGARPGPPGALGLLAVLAAGGWLAAAAVHALTGSGSAVHPATGSGPNAGPETGHPEAPERPEQLAGRPGPWSVSPWSAGPARPGRRRPRPAVLGYGLAAAATLLLPLAAGAGPAQAAMVVAAGAALGAAEWSARWFRHVGRIHLRTAATITDFRSRLRPVLPVAVGLHLAVLAVLTFAALAVLTAVAPRPGPPGGGLLHAVAHRADAVQWAAQGGQGLLLLLAVLLLHCGRAGAAAAALAAGSAGATLLLLQVRPGLGWPLLAEHGPAGALLLGSGPAVAVLLPYAWVVLGRPGSYR